MLGNAWHIPDDAEPPGQASMRSPIVASPQQAVTIISGNQFRGGGGGAANQLQTGSTLFFKTAESTDWSSVPLKFRRASGNNKYFRATIAADTLRAGDTIQYYLRIAYDPNERQTTFLFGSDASSRKTADEAEAREKPFTFAVRRAPVPSGEFASFAAGPLEARIFRDSGQFQLAGPDLAGNDHANVLSFAASVRIADLPVSLGRVRSSSTIVDGLELVQELGADTVTTQLTFPHDGVMRYEVVDWNELQADKTSISVASETSLQERFFGFGEKFNSFDQAGKTVRIVTFDQPGIKGDRSYKPAPWFVSTRGYGLHLDSTAESIFDMRVQGTDRYTVTNLFSALALNVVYGPKLTDVLTRYTGYVGRPPLPPPFAFGPWISSDIWHNGGEVRYAVSKFRQRDVPCSVFVFDSPWETAYNDFQFNIGAGPGVDEETQFGRQGEFEDQPALSSGQRRYAGFASVSEMMTFLQQNGLKVVCWLTPLINTDSVVNEGKSTGQPDGVPGQLKKSPTFDDGQRLGVFVRAEPGGPELAVGWWKGRGSPVDFTSQSARDWLTDQLNALATRSEVITRDGTPEPAIGGFKPDDGEALTNSDSGDTPGGEYIPIGASYADGRSGKEMRNGYCVEYLKTLHGVLGSDGLIFARSGFTSTQAFPACWSGDNKQDFSDGNGLPSVIVAGQSSAMSGFSIWSHDIGGYLNSELSAAAKTDVFMRWTQFGCFTPIMQIHRQPIPNSDLIRQYPWGYPLGDETFHDNAALENFRFYAKLHTRLFPYIYSYAKQSSTTGLPIIRPLVLQHQDDPKTHAINHTYYFGNELLVAPVIDRTNPGEVTKRNVYLPEGSWIEFWTNQRLSGKRVFNWQDANQQHLPLFVREGAIVPMLQSIPDTLCDANYVNNESLTTRDAGLELLIYPSGSSSFQIYDGTQINCDVGAASTKVTIDSVKRRFTVRLHSPRPRTVSRDSVGLTEHATPAAFEAAESGWRHDPASGFVIVKFGHNSNSTQLILDFT